jgi:hypothetical protein
VKYFRRETDNRDMQKDKRAGFHIYELSIADYLIPYFCLQT